MKHFHNNLGRVLDDAEWDAIVVLSTLLKKSFKAPIDTIAVNPQKDDTALVFGLTVSFVMDHPKL